MNVDFSAFTLKGVKCNIKYKCIKEKCKYYFESCSYAEVCTLSSKHKLIDHCVGLEAIPQRIEDIGCEIAKLVKEINLLANEINSLTNLEKLIKENQEKVNECN